jgi:hypothetical protein
MGLITHRWCVHRPTQRYESTYITDPRMEFVSNRAVESANKGMSSSSAKCNVCYLQRSCCICRRLVELKKILPRETLSCRVCLFTHYKEYGKASNTGKLLLAAFPGSVTTCVLGQAEDDARLAALLGRENTLVLYPGEKSVSLRSALNFLQGVAVSGNSSGSGSGGYGGRHDLGLGLGSVTLVVVDGTWRQSKGMYRWLSSLRPTTALENGQQGSAVAPPFCLHVNVNAAVEASGPSGYLNRRQVFPSKSSTVESAAYALATLEEVAGGGGDGGMAEAVLDYCCRALQLSVDGNRTQSGKLARDTSSSTTDPD